MASSRGVVCASSWAACLTTRAAMAEPRLPQLLRRQDVKAGGLGQVGGECVLRVVRGLVPAPLFLCKPPLSCLERK